MATQPYLVIRLVPDAAVDGPTFATYLDGLRLQAVDAYSGAPLSDYAYASPLAISQETGGYGAVVSVLSSISTAFVAANNYGKTLTFEAADAISIGSYVFTNDSAKTIPPGSNLTVVAATATTVTLSGNLPNYVPAGTVVSFAPQTLGTVVTGSSATAPTFNISTNKPATGINGKTPTSAAEALVLPVPSVAGILVGMAVTSTAGIIAANTTVAAVNPASPSSSIPTPSIILSLAPTAVPPAGTPLTLTWSPPYVSLALTPTSVTTSATSTKLTFGSGSGAQGISVGMTLTPGGVIAPGTTVTAATKTTVTVTPPFSGSLTAGQSVTFTFPLSSGIVQDESTNVSFSFSGVSVVIVPESVATAIVPLNLPSTPQYLDIKIVASRDGKVLPLNNTYYNVLYSQDEVPTPDQYQGIPASEVSLYLSLPPPPIESFIPLTIPTDGSPPPFDELVTAVQNALTNDKAVTSTIDQLIASPTDCTRVAYDIVWSYQNALPLPPDDLDSLYTNPPNPGGSADNSSSGSNSYEQDRIKFEGTLSSFYATRNADAERLTKFVAAVSAAIYCEQTTLNSTSALLEFPVDPSAPFASAVESELLVQGLGQGGTSGLVFGIPAAFFYALGATQDKSASAMQRYQTATGDAIERLLQQFSVAINAGVISDSEDYTSPTLAGTTLTSFQAARYLVALRASAASTTPAVTVYAGTPLASLVQQWLNQTDPTPTPPPNPPLTYQNTDFNIWTNQLDASNPQGYLYLDLDALTQGYIIPSFTASVSSAVSAGATLTFAGGGLGISPGMSVSGTNIAPGTVVSAVVTPTTTVSTTTVTLSVPVLGGISTTESITFNAGTRPSTLADQIYAWLPTAASAAPPPTINELKAVRADQWTTFFTVVGNATWLPPFTRPVAPGTSTNVSNPTSGYVALRIRAFVRAVQEFFTVSSIPTTAQPPTPGAPPIFSLPPFDAISQAVANLPSGFSFKSGTLNPADLTTAVQAVFPTEPVAQKWLTEAMNAISQLSQIASVVAEPAVLPNPVSLEFSIVEALYARGFRSANDITRLTAAEFQQALIGTVAYDFANSGATSLYQKASSLPHTTAPPNQQGSDSFQPINPDGSLVNCVPPPCLSPLSPIAYLHEMLELSSASTCENPWPTAAVGTAAAASSQTTLGTAIQTRRGPLGTLLATCANLETPLPLIDIVNENLEYLAATQPPAGNSTSSAPCGTVYNTSADELAGYPLCRTGECDHDGQHGCYEPAAIFSALPEYSTPATPVAANQSVEPTGFNNLKTAISSCLLPYSQPLDVSRTYLGRLGSCRFEELRTFRKCITEFALDPTNPPAGFQSYLWRYPVRIETAIEYLGITPEEYSMLFMGTAAQPCAAATAPTNPNGGSTPGGTSTPNGTSTPGAAPAPNGTSAPSGATAPPVPVPQSRLSAIQLFGLSPSEEQGSNALPLSEFLSALCLTYCEFLAFAKLGMVSVTYGDNDRQGQGVSLPDCEPCCLKSYLLRFPSGDQGEGLALVVFVFIRLWKKLQDVCGARYTFQQLYDICNVLQLTNSSGLNPEFIRQLAAFQMLRDHFKLPLFDPADHTPGATGADRTHLLALWVGSSAKKWNWAVRHFVAGVEGHAKLRFGCARPRDEFVSHMADNLDALSRLAGFTPPTSTSPSTQDSWNSTPGCTLRFAEVLAKMAASTFRLGELLYLFNATPPQDARDPFPMEDPEQSLSYPLGLPEDEPEESLWRLREALLCVAVSEEDACEWTWSRITTALRREFGYNPPSGQDPLLSIGQHFFPDVLSASGFSVSVKQRQYRITLTSSTPWSSPSGSPFQYDSSATQLWLQLPVRDEAVAAALSQLPQLNPTEQAAAQDLYFAPRVDLAFLSFMFPDWQAAEIHLIQECDEERRWAYFRRHFALANARRRIIADHLARHVARRTDCRFEDLNAVAALVLSHLLADENTGTPWESDSGVPPTVLWTPSPSGGAIAALLGLIGTGLLGEYQPVSSPASSPTATASATTTNQGAATSPSSASTGPTQQILWREVRGPLDAFGHERDATNSPVPTVLPPLGLSPGSNPLVVFQNGYADKASDGFRLGGAESFQVRWVGALLIECEGEYAFHAGAPTPEGERPDFERAEKSQWRVTLKRDQKTWTILNHRWPGDTNPERNMPRLRRGAYHIVVEYSQPAPEFAGPHVHPHHTGFQVKYAGPDSEGCLVCLPLHRLYREYQDHTLDQGIQFLPGSKNAQAFLQAFYTSTLRDIRRTYQRAFKAVLFAGKLALSARPNDDGQSELGYLLSNPTLFAGHSYYRTGASSFSAHLANFDFDFLPLQDNYHAGTPMPPDRATPSPQRTAALFDWWERLFDYDQMRREVQPLHKGPLWHLFDSAQQQNPTDPRQLLTHIGAEPSWRAVDLRFYQDQSSPIYSVSSSDLQDDRWLVRVWHANRWILNLLRRFHPKDIATARPDLWASQDPSAPLPAAGVSETGNANLEAFMDAGYLENGEPRRYGDLQRLNDGLRDRGRRALIAYLCTSNRVQLTWLTTPTYATQPRDLSDLLLLDVEAGLCEKASRIEEAISAVQTFVRRARLGLEPGWKVGREFARLWERRFETYHTWERCKRREIYKENWIQWSELGKARRIEAFRFLESKLRTATLTLAAPGGADWWPDTDESLEHAPELLQRRVPSELHALTAPPQSLTREGLATLGTPEYADETTWLTPAGLITATSSGTAGTPGGAPGGAPSNTPAVPASNSTTSNSSAAAPGTSPARVPATPTAGVPATALATSNTQPLIYDPNGGQSQPRQLPFWMESAIKLGTRFLRVAAAGIPQAALRFVPHGDEAHHACCQECGCEHPMLVDEYYFWLIDTKFYAYTDETDSQNDSAAANFTGSYQFGFQDSFYDPYQQQSTEWNDEDQVPQLLAKWQPTPAVRLAWCRVHNGEFQQPRKSVGYVPVSSAADLILLGRAADSLYFQISGGTTPPPPGYKDTSPPGFRFDLPSDEAVALPQVMLPPPLPTQPSPPAPPNTSLYPGGLYSYPFFAYEQPGARLFPDSWFSPALLVADTLRAHCRFDIALKWYQRAFDPLQRDCTWMDCSDSTDSTSPTQGRTPTQGQVPTQGQAPASAQSAGQAATPGQTSTPDSQPTQAEIAAEAYRIWEQHGRPPAEQTEDWLEAESELKAQNAAPTASASGAEAVRASASGAQAARVSASSATVSAAVASTQSAAASVPTAPAPATATTATTAATATTPAGAATTAVTAPSATQSAASTQPIGGSADSQKDAGPCCDSADVSDARARHRALILEFCQTLLDWSDVLVHRQRSPEAFQQARLLIDTVARITGARPKTVLMPESINPVNVSDFVPAFAPLNPRLLDLYDTVADRRALIHNCIGGRRFHNGRLDVDMSYFGDNPLREGWRDVTSPCDDELECCSRPSPYRFTYQIQKALELAGKVRELGAELLSSYEKGDAEILASLHAEQERELLALGLSIRQDQWRDADWQIQGLQQTKDVNQTNLIYYTNLYQNGLINDEIQNLTLATNAMQTRTSANIMAAVGESMTIVPDFFVGAMSTFSQIPIGTKLAGLFNTISKVMQTVADIQSATASIDMTQAQWERRSVEWLNRMRTLPIDIQQTELLLLGAQRRRDQALQELNNQQRQVENAREVENFLRDKFTATELYLHLHKQTAALHSRMYRLARCAALEAQRAYNFELGHTTRRFVPEDTWDSLHDGLMAGPRLESALHHMQKSYQDHNIREYELTKHFSLRLHFPREFMRLKATGRCEIEIPEWMFDLDYPGHYMRRIRNVSLTIPCVTGPYTGVHCRATLLSSQTRIDPRLEVPATRCCCESGEGNGYEACPHDRRIVRTYGAREAIATSSGQNDSGLFELSFRDERYLPFEFHGAVGHWRLELPPENNFFPMESLTDMVMLVNYTSREGGDPLRRAANEVAQRHLPGDGWCFFDVRHEFPDAWQLLRNARDGRVPARLSLRLERRMFPFIPGACDVSIGRMAILFSTRRPDCEDRLQLGECPCPQEEGAGSHTIEITHGSQHRHGEPLRLTCEASEEWPDLFCGVFETQLDRLGRPSECRPEVSFRFPVTTGEVENVYVLCQYRRMSVRRPEYA